MDDDFLGDGPVRRFFPREEEEGVIGLGRFNDDTAEPTSELTSTSESVSAELRDTGEGAVEDGGVSTDKSMIDDALESLLLGG